MTQDTACPADVFHRLVDGVSRLVAGDASQMAELTGLYAERTYVEHPMALDDIPLLTRDDVRRHFAAGTDMTPIADYRAADIVIHQTIDPEVVVAEFRYLGSVGGRSFRVPCVFVMRVRDGEIVESRDYISPLDRERALRETDESGPVR